MEIVTTAAFQAGANTTDLVVNNPTGQTLDGRAPLPGVHRPGRRGGARSQRHADAWPPGRAWCRSPGTRPASARPTTPGKDYIVMAFWTDYQGNILDTAGRPLSSFQEDPKPAFAMSAADETWDFGTAPQGSMLKRTFTFANTGHAGAADLRQRAGGGERLAGGQPGSWARRTPPATRSS